MSTFSGNIRYVGIATLQTTSQPKTKVAGLTRHQLAIYYIGLPIFALGFLVIYHSKTRRNMEHYTTWHGVLLHNLAGNESEG